MSPTEPRWPGHWFCQFEKRLPQPEIKSTCGTHPLQSCLAFHWIFDLLLKISFWANFFSSYYTVFSYLVENSIQRNMNRRGEKRVGDGRDKSPWFVYHYNKRNESVTLASKQSLYICMVRQNVVKTTVTHSPAARVPLLCFYDILTSSVIYYWTDARQHGIYLLNIYQKPCIRFHTKIYHYLKLSWRNISVLPNQKTKSVGVCIIRTLVSNFKTYL